MSRVPFPEPDHLEPQTEGDGRMAIGRLRAMGRHHPADELEWRQDPFLRLHHQVAEEGT